MTKRRRMLASAANLRYLVGGWLMVIAALAWAQTGAGPVPDPEADLRTAIAAIEAEYPGKLGVYAKHLGTNEQLNYRAERPWYLASTVKLPLAIAVLQAAREGRLSLDDQMVLQESHFVDGAGQLLWQEPGATYTVSSLIGHSLENSDSTATDWLMNHLGVDEFNRQIQEHMVADGFEPFTTILQVRYDAYGELHPRAAELSNMDYVRFRSAGDYDARLQAFIRELGLAPSDLRVNSLEQAFARYYQRNLNSGTLVAFGQLLERLVRGELLNAEDTERLLNHTQRITTGDDRLKAGLPKGTPFAQKTGTQIERACNVGVVYPEDLERAVVIAACAENFDEIANAEHQFEQVAEALGDAGWLQ